MEHLDIKNRLKLFGMQNLTLEADLLSLERKGIEIGHEETIQKEEVVDLDLFEVDIKQKARKMSELYYLYFCLENSTRRLVSGRLSEKYGQNWWDTDKVPEDVKIEVKRHQDEEKNTTSAIRSEDQMFYTNFGDLIKIIEHNWADFSDTLRSQKAVRENLSRLNRLRNPIAHSCELDEDEILRFKLYIKDWQRIQS
jgi:Swt1-like HEPN